MLSHVNTKFSLIKTSEDYFSLFNLHLEITKKKMLNLLMCLTSTSTFSIFLLALSSVIGLHNYTRFKNYLTKQYIKYFPQKYKI